LNEITNQLFRKDFSETKPDFEKRIDIDNQISSMNDKDDKEFQEFVDFLKDDPNQKETDIQKSVTDQCKNQPTSEDHPESDLNYSSIKDNIQYCKDKLNDKKISSEEMGVYVKTLNGRSKALICKFL